jgi:hypothetical protein
MFTRSPSRTPSSPAAHSDRDAGVSDDKPAILTAPNVNYVGFYERSVQLDRAFALAWARLSRANAQVYFDGLDTTSARRDATERALNIAQKLQPNSPRML